MNLTDNVTVLVAQITADLGPRIARMPTYGYQDSLALCAIDSVYSLTAKYQATTNVVNRYKTARGALAETDSLLDLVAAIDAAGGPEAAAVSLFGNRNVAPGTRKLKSIALYNAASRMAEAEFSSTEQLRAAATSENGLESVGKLWRREPGLGYASWTYLAMLAGVEGVKVDRMILRYVGRVLGTGELDKKRITAAVAGAASHFGVTVSELDNAIWRKESGRAPLPVEDVSVSL